MTNFAHASLGDQIAKKISIWILVLIVAITVAVFTVSFFQAKQMFVKHVDSWRTIVPRQTIANLIDSDHFSIQREAKFLESTGLFSIFCMMDNQKRVITSFGNVPCTNVEMNPIFDEARVVWGYYYFKPNFYQYIIPFLISALISFILIVILYFLIKLRVRSNLNIEFTRFNRFLGEIERLTENIHQFYGEGECAYFNKTITYHAEEAIINKAITSLLSEIKKANQSLREAVSMAEQKRFQDELTATALQVVHDIGSPLAVLEMIVRSVSATLPVDSRTDICHAAEKIRNITNSLLKKAKHESTALIVTQHPLHSVLNQIVSEVHTQYRLNENLHITLRGIQVSSYDVFVMINLVEFHRALSNIINNAVESITNKQGEIMVSLHCDNNSAMVNVQDNGVGISPEMIERLGGFGITHGKDNGHGFGLFHAKQTIESWGGQLNIQSEVKFGTLVSIQLPRTRPPS